MIICIAPHNVLPWGNTGAFSKLFGNRTTVWAAAPILFKIPLLRPILERYGTFSANKKGILKALSDGYNVGVVLDGIAGMFCEAKLGHEELYLRARKVRNTKWRSTSSVGVSGQVRGRIRAGYLAMEHHPCAAPALLFCACNVHATYIRAGMLRHGLHGVM